MALTDTLTEKWLQPTQWDRDSSRLGGAPARLDYGPTCSCMYGVHTIPVSRWLIGLHDCER